MLITFLLYHQCIHWITRLCYSKRISPQYLLLERLFWRKPIFPQCLTILFQLSLFCIYWAEIFAILATSEKMNGCRFALLSCWGSDLVESGSEDRQREDRYWQDSGSQPVFRDTRVWLEICSIATSKPRKNSTNTLYCNTSLCYFLPNRCFVSKKKHWSSKSM